MFGWFKQQWELRLDINDLCNEVDRLEDENEQLALTIQDLLSERKKLRAELKDVETLRKELKEARRQSDAFEKVSREACAELEGRKGPKGSKPGKKG